jgi:hypothetical protein
MIGATIWGSNDENGEYSLIYTIKEEDISGETANIDLGKFADFRFVKYVSSENGYCNVSEIALVYDVCNPEASIENGELKISLNENVETGGEKAVIGYYSGTSLTKSVICDFEDSKSAFAEALESDSDVSVTVLGKENSLLCRLFIKKY